MIFKNNEISISIRSKFLLLWLVLVTIIGAWVALSAELLIRQVLQNDLTLRGVAVARNVAARCANAMIANDLHELLQAVTDTMEHNPDFVYLLVLDRDNELIVNSDPDRQIPQALLFLHGTKEIKEYSSATFRSETGNVCDVAVPILSGMLGTVRIGLSESELHRSVVETRTDLLVSILIAFILGTVITVLFTNKMLAPLQQLTDATSAIAAQNFTARVQIENGDEIGRLAAAFNHMVEQLGSFRSENIAHKEELERKDKLRVQLVKRLITAQEEERKRISRELHDEAAQSLTALKLGLKAIEEADPPETIRQLIRELRTMLGATLSEIAAIAKNLRPSVLDDMGLEAAVAKLVETAAQRTGSKLHFSSRGLAAKRFPFYIETAVYRIIQEALTNSIKYAGAASIWVCLDCTEQLLSASVRDNGTGFEPEKVLDGSEPQKGLGLFGMQERAMLTGGTLFIDSAPGLGTTITVTYPL